MFLTKFVVKKPSGPIRYLQYIRNKDLTRLGFNCVSSSFSSHLKLILCRVMSMFEHICIFLLNMLALENQLTLVFKSIAGRMGQMFTEKLIFLIF